MLFLMEKKFPVDGVYDLDPKTNPNVVKFDELTYNDYHKELKSNGCYIYNLCKDNNILLLYLV